MFFFKIITKLKIKGSKLNNKLNHSLCKKYRSNLFFSNLSRWICYSIFEKNYGKISKI